MKSRESALRLVTDGDIFGRSADCFLLFLLLSLLVMLYSTCNHPVYPLLPSSILCFITLSNGGLSQSLQDKIGNVSPQDKLKEERTYNILLGLSCNLCLFWLFPAYPLLSLALLEHPFLGDMIGNPIEVLLDKDVPSI